MTTQLRKGLIDLARKIGRWLIEHLARRGAMMLLGYMRGKIDDFHRRRAKAKTERRKAWLLGRIRRWSRAAQWVADRLDDLLACTGAEFDALTRVAGGLPVVAACEKAVT